MLKTAHPLQWLIVAGFGVYIGIHLIRAGNGDSPKALHLREFGSVLVVDGGRVKPLDTFARGQLILLNSKQEYQDAEGNSPPATQWFLDVMTTDAKARTGPAMDHKIFRIENTEVLALLHLDPRPGKWRYALREFAGRLDAVKNEATRIRDSKKPAKDRTVYEAKLLELDGHLGIFMAISAGRTPAFIPSRTDDWFTLAEAFQFARGPDGQLDDQKLSPLANLIGRELLNDYSRNDTERFNDGVKLYHEAFNKLMPQAVSTARLEVYLNDLAPFILCAALYACVFVLACVSWLGWFPVLNRGAFWSMLLIALLHTWALGMRIYIQGRPPVTNLYSSAIFIGWGCVMTCLIFEYFFRNSVALAVGSITGALSLLIAHYLSLESADTMEMMRAVLDTNFWLATHVTCITLGYTATFVAGFMGITYVAAMAISAVLAQIAGAGNARLRTFLESPESRLGARGFFTRFFETDAAAVMSRMIYGVVCFAMFLSFTGTVLGGLWADYSWGRFWGWDPKENGALLIVIWSALILHARWGGMVKQRGIAILAVLGNIVTSWSWFGTNFLGVGLHSYGFMAGAMSWLMIFDCIMLTIAGIGLLPLREWAKLPERMPQQEPKETVSV
jgi:ABC-type transport system involved in cytochrome c biogenesis permease subunit